MGRTIKFEDVRAEYATLWHECEIRPERLKTVQATARKIIANRPRYDVISRATGVPWFVIGIIHQMECSLSFNKHIHNGDPLTGRTKLVPAGRPKQWPPSGQDPFIASAIDALTMPGKEFDKITDWSIERIAYTLELYNGFGYRLYRHINSPYLWSFTSHYKSGKYVADGKWSKTAVSGQSGGMAILKALMDLDPLAVDLRDPEPERAWPVAPGPDVVAAPGATTPAVEAVKSRSVWSLVTAGCLAVVQPLTDWAGRAADAASEWIGLVPQVHTEVTTVMEPLNGLGSLLRVNLGAVTASVAGVLILVAIVRHSKDKAELVNRRAQGEGD